MTRDELDRRIQDLSRRAEANYKSDSAGVVLTYLRDAIEELEGFESAEFIDGYVQAVHNAAYIYVSNEYSCNCPKARPSPELRNGEPHNVWVCAECREELVEWGNERRTTEQDDEQTEDA